MNVNRPQSPGEQHSSMTPPGTQPVEWSPTIKVDIDKINQSLEDDWKQGHEYEERLRLENWRQACQTLSPLLVDETSSSDGQTHQTPWLKKFTRKTGPIIAFATLVFSITACDGSEGAVNPTQAATQPTTPTTPATLEIETSTPPPSPTPSPRPTSTPAPTSTHTPEKPWTGEAHLPGELPDDPTQNYHLSCEANAAANATSLIDLGIPEQDILIAMGAISIDPDGKLIFHSPAENPDEGLVGYVNGLGEVTNAAWLATKDPRFGYGIHAPALAKVLRESFGLNAYAISAPTQDEANEIIKEAIAHGHAVIVYETRGPKYGEPEYEEYVDHNGKKYRLVLGLHCQAVVGYHYESGEFVLEIFDGGQGVMYYPTHVPNSNLLGWYEDGIFHPNMMVIIEK